MLTGEARPSKLGGSRRVQPYRPATAEYVLRKHFTGLTPLSPGSLADGLLLLLWLSSPETTEIGSDTNLLSGVSGCVDPEGFEPSTFSMPLRRAPNCAMGPYSIVLAGWEPSPPSGPGGIRTLGLLSAIETRSQLRYRPLF